LCLSVVAQIYTFNEVYNISEHAYFKSSSTLVGTLSKHSEQKREKIKLECGPMPNLMVALPNIGGALCSTLQSLADAHY